MRYGVVVLCAGVITLVVSVLGFFITEDLHHNTDCEDRGGVVLKSYGTYICAKVEVLK